MIVVRTLVEFKYSFAGLEMVSVQQACLFELREHPIDSCKTNIHILCEQNFINIFSTQMAHGAGLKNFQNLQAWQRCLKPTGFEIICMTRHKVIDSGRDALSYSLFVGMPNLPSLPMQALSLHQARPHALKIAIAFAVLLSGCAAKNPLIDAPSASSDAAKATAGDNTVATQQSHTQRILGRLSPYRIEIQQGNFVSREMVEQLREGMTREQVRFVLGTPLLTDLFHTDRWDYAFRLRKHSGESIASQVTVYFESDRLVRHEGAELPSEAEYLAFIAGPKKN